MKYSIGDRVKIKSGDKFKTNIQSIIHGNIPDNNTEGEVVEIENNLYVVKSTTMTGSSKPTTQLGFEEDNLELLVPVQQEYPIY